MPTSLDAPDQVRILRRTLRDLVALSSLPAVWAGFAPPAIAASLAEVLLSMLGLELAYVRLPGGTNRDTIEVTRTTFEPAAPEQIQVLGQALAPWLRSDPSHPPQSIPHPFGSGSLRVAIVRFGYTGDEGTFLAGSTRADFPGERDRLLLNVGVNQAAILLQRKQVEDSLRENEQRFRLLANSVPAVVWTAAPDGTITFASERWYAYTGLTAEQIAQDWPRLVLHPEDYERCLAEWTTALREGKEYSIEVRNRRYDGEYRWWITRATPIRNAAGVVTAWFGSSTDIHDLKLAQEALKQSDSRKDEFLATLAHELRNPLAPIRDGVHLLRLGHDAAPRPDEDQKLLQMLDRQVNYLVRLVDDLMEVSRITRGKIELHKQRLSLAEVIASAIETSRPLLEAGEHEFKVSLPAQSIILDADPVRLAQVVANLLNNAAKYTNQRGCIELTATCEGNEVALRVRDNGVGIPPEMLPRIFDLFIQVDHSAGRAQGGLGIGLALVKSLVGLHGGRIEAKSRGAGQGSEFTIYLPRIAEALPELPAPQLRAAGSPMAVRRILIVDDNEDGARSLGKVLRRKGNDVLIVHDGPAALAAVADYQPAVVLMDIGMPEMDGYEVARRLRARPDGKDLLLIALTGWGQEEDRRHSRAAGFDHHLVKPVDLDALQTLLASLKPP